jgi:hypothetical protein
MLAELFFEHTVTSAGIAARPPQMRGRLLAHMTTQRDVETSVWLFYYFGSLGQWVLASYMQIPLYVHQSVTLCQY